jgi:ribosomal protein S18 acetylase RimI-like enzyme
MSQSHDIMLAEPEDTQAILNIAEATALFEGDGLAWLGETIGECFDGSRKGHIWLVAKNHDGEVHGAAYYAPEPFTDGVVNLYFLGVLPGQQGSGLGAILVHHVEHAAIAGEQRVLLIETSGVEGFEPTRAFYRAQGFSEESRIRDYYEDGDDKVTFWKRLQRSA